MIKKNNNVEAGNNNSSNRKDWEYEMLKCYYVHNQEHRQAEKTEKKKKKKTAKNQCFEYECKVEIELCRLD